MAHSKEKNKSTETVSEENLMVNVLDKNFKANYLKYALKILKEVVQKVKKTVCEQNGNMNTKKNLKRNYGDRKYNK